MTNKGIRQEVFRKALGKCLVAFQFFQFFQLFFSVSYLVKNLYYYNKTILLHFLSNLKN